MRFSNLSTTALLLSRTALAFGPTKNRAPVVRSMAAKARDSLTETTKDGEFKRTDAAWRDWVSRKEGAKFAPEKDRVRGLV